MMNTESFVKRPKLAKPWIYFLATFAWTGSFFGLAYLMNVSAESGGALGVILILLALAGPAVMGRPSPHQPFGCDGASYISLG